MRIVIDINHPAHVHFFKNFIWEAEKKGHEVMITASDKDIAFQLLDYYNFEYVKLGNYGKKILEKAVNVPIIDYRMYNAVKDFKPEILMGIASARVAHVSKLIKGSRSYIFDDTDFATFQIMLYKHLSDRICVPDCFLASRSSKHVDYKGYHELAYLHPNWFKKDLSVLKEYGLEPEEKFFILRFVAWEATHDVGGKGFSMEGKIKIVNELSKYGKVIISSEKNVPEEIKKYILKIHPARIHHLMAEASLYMGEGATMASEATVLGTPSIYINNLNDGYIGTIMDQAKYGLMYIPDETEALEKAIDIAKNTEKYKEEYSKKREQLLSDKIDVSRWMLDLILNPSREMISDPVKKDETGNLYQRYFSEIFSLKVSQTWYKFLNFHNVMKNFKVIFGVFLLTICLVLVTIYLKNHIEDFKIIKNVSIKDFSVLCLLSFLFYMSGIIEIEMVSKFCKIKVKIIDNINLIMVTLLGNYFFPYSGVGFRAGFLKNVYNLKYMDFITTFAATYILKLIVYISFGIIAFGIFIANNSGINNGSVNFNHLAVLVTIILLCFVPFIPLKLKYRGKNKIILTFLDIYYAWNKVTKDRKLLLGLFLQNILEFFILSTIFMFAYQSFGIKTEYVNCLLPASFSVLSFIFKITPGAFGIYEGLIMFSSSIIGVSMFEGLLVATLIRISGLVWILPCGFMSLIFLSKKLRLNNKNIDKQ